MADAKDTEQAQQPAQPKQQTGQEPAQPSKEVKELTKKLADAEAALETAKDDHKKELDAQQKTFDEKLEAVNAKHDEEVRELSTKLAEATSEAKKLNGLTKDGKKKLIFELFEKNVNLDTISQKTGMTVLEVTEVLREKHEIN